MPDKNCYTPSSVWTWLRIISIFFFFVKNWLSVDFQRKTTFQNLSTDRDRFDTTWRRWSIIITDRSNQIVCDRSQFTESITLITCMWTVSKLYITGECVSQSCLALGQPLHNGAGPTPVSRRLFYLFRLWVKGKKSYPCNRSWNPIGLWDVEAPTLSLDSRLTDGSKVVSLPRRPPFTPQEYSWNSFLLEAESTQGP
jgi:hypothetical protein